MNAHRDSAAASADAVIDAIRSAASGLQLDVSEFQVRQLAAYVGLLMRWNETYNLTAIRDLADVVAQHMADCLGCVGPLRLELAGATTPRVLDVGSGGGLPGAVIAMTCPQIDVTCVDTVGKKAAFVVHVAAELKLANLRAVHARVETGAFATSQGGFDVVCCRAFSSLEKFVTLTRSVLKPEGKWLAMKGVLPVSEIAELPDDITVFHVEPLRIPGLRAERCLVWMRSTRGS